MRQHPRRYVLALFGTATAAGSISYVWNEWNQNEHRYQLVFVPIVNNNFGAADIDLRVRRAGEVVFESTYEEIPNHQAADEETGVDSREDLQAYGGYYTDRPNVRFIRPDWEADPASYSIEYRLSQQSEWQQTEIDAEMPYAAAQMFILGGGSTPRAVSFRINEFESRDQLEKFESEAGLNESLIPEDDSQS
jgi:hypothetical protein